MVQVKLTKQLINGKSLIISPSYVSNEHRLAHRAIFKNNYILSDPYEALKVRYTEEDDKYIERVLLQYKNLHQLSKTDWILEREIYGKKKLQQLQLFTTEDSKGMFFNKKYIDGFQIDVLWFTEEDGIISPAINAQNWEEASVAIMPIENRDGVRILEYELPMII